MPVPSDTSARLALPYLAPSQAQKHVTHNEALLLLDSLVQLSVVEVDATVPPGDPAAGDIHALGSAAEGAWAGQDGKLAAWDGAAWHFLDPREGWRAYDLAAGRGVVFDGSAWQPEVSELQDLEGVGVNTGWDGVNRLSVAAQASLFSHDGAGGGHQLKINKATAADTASLLFQSGWTGHAEMGLAGDTGFSVKISADGSSWAEALKMDPASGETSFAPDGTVRATLSAAGLDVAVPLTGEAVQDQPLDGGATRVMKVGAFGLGGRDLAAATVADGQEDLASGFYGGTGGSAVNFPGVTKYYPFLNLNRRIGTGSYRQVRLFFSADTMVMRSSDDLGASWSDDVEFYSNETILGTVSQSGGVPTGAVIERGSNANGDYVRYADGTQVCTQQKVVNTAIDQASGGLFVNAADLTATHAATFSGAGPNVSLQVLLPGSTPHDIGAVLTASGLSAASFRLTRMQADATARDITCQVTAIGRWF